MALACSLRVTVTLRDAFANIFAAISFASAMRCCIGLGRRRVVSKIQPRKSRCRLGLHWFLGVSVPLGLRVSCFTSKILSVASHGAETFGMFTTFKGEGKLALKPLQSGLNSNKAVYAIVKGPWEDVERSPMGSSTASCWKELGAPPFLAVVAKLRTRLFLKCPQLKTWLRKLNKRRHLCKTEHKKQRGNFNVSFFDSHLSFIARLKKWAKDQDNARPVSQVDLNFLQRADNNECDPESESALRAIKQVGLSVQAVVRAQFHQDDSTKSLRVHATFKFDKSTSTLARFSNAFPELAKAAHWMVRMRSGSFITFGQTVRASLLIDIGDRRCGCCKTRSGTPKGLKEARDVCGPRRLASRLGLTKMTKSC